MRRSAGDTVCVFNGRDGEFGGRIESIRRDRAALRIEQQLRVQAQEPDIWLLFALLKRDATDLVVRAATELGVADLHPVITERSNTHRVNRRTAVRDRHRGCRAVRTPDHPSAASAIAHDGATGRLAQRSAAVRNARARRCTAPAGAVLPDRVRRRCWSVRKAASHRQSLTCCARIPLLLRSRWARASSGRRPPALPGWPCCRGCVAPGRHPI